MSYKLKKQYGIDFMIPAKKNFKVTKRITKQAQEEGYEKIKPGLEIEQFKKITDAPNYKGNLQAIVIKDRKFKKKRKSNQPEYAYFTSLSWKNALSLYEHTVGDGPSKTMQLKNYVNIGFLKISIAPSLMQSVLRSCFLLLCLICTYCSNPGMADVFQRNRLLPKEAWL